MLNKENEMNDLKDWELGNDMDSYLFRSDSSEEVEKYEEDEEVVLNFPDPGGFDTANIVALDRVSFGYSSDKMLIEDVDLTIDMKSRIALLGRNGCGTCSCFDLRFPHCF